PDRGSRTFPVRTRSPWFAAQASRLADRHCRRSGEAVALPRCLAGSCEGESRWCVSSHRDTVRILALWERIDDPPRLCRRERLEAACRRERTERWAFPALSARVSGILVRLA